MALCRSDKAWSAITLFSSDATGLDVTVKHKDLEASTVAPFGNVVDDCVIGEVVVIHGLPKSLHAALSFDVGSEHLSEGVPIDFPAWANDVTP